MIIKMKLKSDAIPSSGNSLAGIIDRDVDYDIFGIPFIPAKRLKGILRESAENLSIKNIDDIFGVANSKKGSVFKIDNGVLPYEKELRNFLNSKYTKNIFSQEAVLDYFTYTRSQTTIENGIAKENSLRISRVLKKGLEFHFNFECKEEHLEDIKSIIKITRNFGASRTRGFGEIELSIMEDGDKTDNYYKSIKKDSSLENSDEFFKIVITIENIEPLLISSTPGQSQVSEDYICGANILGVLANAYLKEKSCDDKFRELFLSGEISFGNLYPSVEDNIYYPSPLSIKKVKVSDNVYYQYFDFSVDDEPDDNVIFKGGFEQFSYKELTTGVIKKTESHHRRPKNRAIAKSNDEDGEFFQFEVIEQGQFFMGEIIGRGKLLYELLDYFPKNGVIRLGKSKTGQYGKCIYEIKKIQKINKNFVWEKEENKSFIFQSDMILLNENGFAIPDINIFIKEFAEKININPSDLSLEKYFLKVNNTGGFLGVWKLPRIQKPAISSGTVVVIKNKSGKNINISNIDAMFFGDRTEDGYGRINIYEVINEDGKIIKENDYDINKKYDSVDLNNISDEIKDIKDFLVKKVIKEELLSGIIRNAKENQINSFISKIIVYLKNSNDLSEFEEKLKETDSSIQKDNLKKIAEYICVENGTVNKKKFIDKLNQAQKDINDNVKIKFHDNENEIYFELYKYYVLSYLYQVKYLNRKGGK